MAYASSYLPSGILGKQASQPAITLHCERMRGAWRSKDTSTDDENHSCLNTGSLTSIVAFSRITRVLGRQARSVRKKVAFRLKPAHWQHMPLK